MFIGLLTFFFGLFQIVTMANFEGLFWVGTGVTEMIIGSFLYDVGKKKTA